MCIRDRLNTTAKLQATFNPINAITKQFEEKWKKPDRELRSKIALLGQTLTGSATFNKHKNTKSS